MIGNILLSSGMPLQWTADTLVISIAQEAVSAQSADVQNTPFYHGQQLALYTFWAVECPSSWNRPPSVDGWGFVYLYVKFLIWILLSLLWPPQTTRTTIWWIGHLMLWDKGWKNHCKGIRIFLQNFDRFEGQTCWSTKPLAGYLSQFFTERLYWPATSSNTLLVTTKTLYHLFALLNWK